MKKQSALLTKIVIVLVSLFVMFSFTTCDFLFGNVKEPEVSLESVDLIGIDWNGVDLRCTVNVENPNSFVIPFPDTKWVFYLDNKYLLSVDIEKDKVDDSQTVKKQVGYESLVINAGESVPIKFDVNFNFLKIFQTLKDLKGKDKVDYKIELEIYIPLNALDTVIPIKIEIKDEIEMLKAPTLKPIKFDTPKIDLSGIKFATSFDFVNTNSFPLPAPTLNYSYKVSTNSSTSTPVNGGIPSTEIAPNTTTAIPHSMEVSSVQVGSALFTSIFGGTKADHAFTYSCDFHIPALSDINVKDKEMKF